MVWIVVDGLILAVLLAGAIAYTRGWLRLRRRGSRLASLFRLAAFFLATFCVGAALLPPLNRLGGQYLFVRSAQTVLLCLLAAPAFFVSCGYDVMLWGLPAATRRAIHRAVQGDSRTAHVIRQTTQPWITWMLFVALFLVWHDPGFANWALARPAIHTLSLVVLGLAALLFWWHVVGTGPRLHAEFAPWLVAFVLVFTEIANLATSASIAFASDPIYTHYSMAAQAMGNQRTLTALEDQELGGGLLWVVGSAVYVSSIVLVLNRLFERHGIDRPEHLPNWDAEHRMIAPGLEHRVDPTERLRRFASDE